ncbi:conserved protein of unknown function [Pseudomonas sp. JV551A1]|uniref:Uncharacterized protein n=1 Tax=Pseudomonas inefficax TaxID=2078786 RepID=A0AAQ1P940_9PSED|nr:conserved protein of unknown function [Pseudomonas sp. JV551A1]SPO60050.1 conserved protein of unknown function [Pseudomonas inefficax]
MRWDHSALEYRNIRHSRSERLAGSGDDRLQRFIAAVLFRVEPLGVAGDAVFVYQGEAEAALARGNDKALQRREGLGEGANRSLNLMMSLHIVGGSCFKHGVMIRA